MQLQSRITGLALGLAGALWLSMLGACSDSKSDESDPSGNEGGSGQREPDEDAPKGGSPDDEGAAGEPPIESAAGAGGATTEPEPEPVDGAFEVLPVPEGASTGLPLAFNDEGDVLLGAAVDALEFNTLFVLNDGVAKKFETGDLDVSLNGLNVAACINNSGQIGFNAQREGAHLSAFYDGNEIVELSFGEANSQSLVLRGCNDAGTVVASTVTGTEAWSWNDGTASPLVQNAFAVTLLGINQTGDVAFSSGLHQAGEFAAYPSSLLASTGPSELGKVAGMVLDLQQGSTALSTWQKGDSAATPIDALPDVEGVTAVGISDHGVVLSASSGSRRVRLWLSADGAAKELTAEGYVLERVVDVNESGEILVAARAEDEHPISGLILRP